MKTHKIPPIKALNKAFLKVKPNRDDFEKFKHNLIRLIDNINEAESEEFHKNLVAQFLRETYHGANYFINTKGRNDLVIHNGKNAKNSVGVILEAKKPTNKGEMLKVDNLNSKAFQELVLYFLRDRISGKNLEIKYLVATNVYEWFIFDAGTFEKAFAQNQQLVKLFTDFEAGRLTGKKTDFFYQEIAAPAIEAIKDEITFTHFDLRDYEQFLRNAEKQDDNQLIPLFKLLSPEHLLKLPLANDSNSLDQAFYRELLHIIGLTETKAGGKKLIGRKKADRNIGALIENAIDQLDSLDKISRLEKPEQFGDTYQDRLFNVGLELAITWVNRILFLKLLEAQLIKYHKSDKSLAFLNLSKVNNYDDLNSLFFSVLARQPQERSSSIQNIFAKVPYLNSSLFELTELEHLTISISNLRDDHLPIFSSSVLKDSNGKKRTGELNALEYLLEFLNAYDFSSEGSSEIQEYNKRLINASVLGLIFEKINGYKDGAFFTPGFITMYMCRETIRRAVLQKFNQTNSWECQNIDQLYDKITDKKAANQMINSLKICDPAVGSGHFLVSALNEIIAIKSELKILLDRQGKTLRDSQVEVVNDELIVTDEDGKLFEYNPKSQESQRIQETLFHEKQKIIENCLFGVDINPNSVKICRLRLWIELLKNAYYKEDPPQPPLLRGENSLKVPLFKGDLGGSPYKEEPPQPPLLRGENSLKVPLFKGDLGGSPGLKTRPRGERLETLPNIDINIKCGNSLISRFALDSDLRQALRKSKCDIDSYTNAVQTYRNAESKEQKREMEGIISSIKGNFRTTLYGNDSKKTKLRNLEGERYNLENQMLLFQESTTDQKTREKKITKLSNEIDRLEVEIEEIESGKIYENAFEWRFEFPEVLNNDGDFVGFDVVIGNPPYIRQSEIKNQKSYLQTNFATYSGTADLYVFFIEKGFEILKRTGQFCYIMPNKWMQAGYGKALRTFFLENQLQAIIDFGDVQVFEEATTYPCILNASKQKDKSNFISAAVKTLNYSNGFAAYLESISNEITVETLNNETWVISSGGDQKLLSVIKSKGVSLAEYIGGEAHYGIKTGLTEAFVISNETSRELISIDKRSSEIIRPFILGRNIKPYAIPETERCLIKIEKGFTNSAKGNQDAWIWFCSNYLAISNYLSGFKERAEKRTDQGDYWWELRSCDYYPKFDQPKIMYQTFQVKPCFIYDAQGLYCNNSLWIISKAEQVLLAILNSKMGWWLISKYCTAIQNGFQLIWKYFGQIPIPTANQEQAKLITSLVDQILTAKKFNPNADTTRLEAEIDRLVYQLYELTAEEIKIVEGETA
jgi:adenine-specific DNA-methyltransferase